jgi:cell division protease FtsH
VIGREGKNGYMQNEERQSRHFSKQEALDEICVALGGRAAEMEYYGAHGIAAGASGDLEHATRLARKMVCRWGMFEEEIGLGVITQEEFQTNGAAQALVNRILSEQLGRARQIIVEKRALCDRMVEALLASKGKYLTQREIKEIYESAVI